MDVCDMFMFDTEGAGYGGTDKKIDLSILKDKTIGKPFFVAGGIDMGDTDSLQAFSRTATGKGLFAVDINTKFETSPGIKDMQRVKQFLGQMKD
jgi:phosphoribosylanthranilate isomerase